MKYERILAAVVSTPWAIEPTKGRQLAAILTDRANGVKATDAEVLAAVAAKRSKGPPRVKQVALVAIHGVMTQRAGAFDEMSGMVSTDSVGRLVDEAAADPSVDAIVLDIASPGGSVFGTAELGIKVRAAAEKKKVVAVANSIAASAAYWVASQASELVVTPGGQVGSIGVYQMHRDVSKQLEATGEKVTLVFAGKHKVAANPFGPLDDTGLSVLQKEVADYYDQFVKAVAKGRGVTPAAVRDGFGEGDTVRAQEAVSLGMADKVATLDDVLARYGVTLADVAPAAVADRHPVEVRRRKLQLDD